MTRLLYKFLYKDHMQNYELRWNFILELSKAKEQQVSRGELCRQHKEQGRGATSALAEQQHEQREAAARIEQPHRRREATAI